MEALLNLLKVVLNNTLPIHILTMNALKYLKNILKLLQLDQLHNKDLDNKAKVKVLTLMTKMKFLLEIFHMIWKKKILPNFSKTVVKLEVSEN